MTDDTMVERVAEAHVIVGNGYVAGERSGFYVVCSCSGATTSTIEPERIWADDYVAHIATALLPLVREAQAEALEEAAAMVLEVAQDQLRLADALVNSVSSPSQRSADRVYDLAGAIRDVSRMLRTRAATYRTGDDHAR